MVTYVLEVQVLTNPYYNTRKTNNRSNIFLIPQDVKLTQADLNMQTSLALILICHSVA